jgi:hypothetical protein
MKVGEVWKCKEIIAENMQGYYFIKEYLGNDNWRVMVAFDEVGANPPSRTFPHMTETTGEHIHKICVLDKK